MQKKLYAYNFGIYGIILNDKYYNGTYILNTKMVIINDLKQFIQYTIACIVS